VFTARYEVNLYTWFRLSLFIRDWSFSIRPYEWRQDRQCAYNITLRRILFLWKSNKCYIFLCVCVWGGVCARTCSRVGEYMRVRVGGCTCSGMCFLVCSLTYPPCNPPPYCHLRPLWLHHIFRHYLINGTIFGKKVLNIKCVFWFSTIFTWNISYFRKNSEIYFHKCGNLFM
jgi:hypothetical protein